jgi:hypothetical protein
LTPRAAEASNVTWQPPTYPRLRGWLAEFAGLALATIAVALATSVRLV